ncbi:sushi, von Willebrand factor type A, EGF and pentraxin domain-containing protein 1-like [Pocillopora damicornis]|uniref:sushi, von Willebrand factor type A, EGF and pentraxin domain-containing protein 1-like n=1 Tax=Pocillopora damicornis TaxID=46731 RepID=UPI000F550BE4|nr:sushi, von Willebrand factor type A, EGF and pentraxin domain-containing protein 1-like [Pocillopora damicornis]
MVDGKVASIDELQRVYSFPAQTKLVLGRAFGQSALAGYVGGLNIWGTILEKRTIVALYRGNGRESGNVFSWFALKDDIPGALLPLKEAINSEDVHKEEESDFTLHFPTRSTKNVANTSFSVKDTVKRFTACAWYKTEEKGTLFQYVPYNKDSMNDSFLLAVSSDGNLDIRYGEDKGNTTSLRLTDNQWHHVCFTWRRLAVSVNIYSDGELSTVMNLKTDRILNISGNFIVGQGLDDSKSNFVLEKSFVGKITGVNFWDILLDFNTIVTLSRDCRSSWGTELSWGSFRNGFHGDVQLIENSECLVPDYTVQSLRDDRCNDKHAINSYNCPSAMKALFGRVNSTSGRLWRCYSESALERDSINGVLIFNHRTGRQECIVDAHEELLTIT